MSDLKRRDFFSLLGGAAAAWPLTARAQPSVKSHRIGFLGVFSHTGSAPTRLREGKSITIE
jgi:hypothetical protein